MHVHIQITTIPKPPPPPPPPPGPPPPPPRDTSHVFSCNHVFFVALNCLPTAKTSAKKVTMSKKSMPPRKKKRRHLATRDISFIDLHFTYFNLVPARDAQENVRNLKKYIRNKT